MRLLSKGYIIVDINTVLFISLNQFHTACGYTNNALLHICPFKEDKKSFSLSESFTYSKFLCFVKHSRGMTKWFYLTNVSVIRHFTYRNTVFYKTETFESSESAFFFRAYNHIHKLLGQIC